MSDPFQLLSPGLPNPIQCPPTSQPHRSIAALEGDLNTLEKKYNMCSEHLAKGETVDFNKEWPSMQTDFKKCRWTNHVCKETRIAMIFLLWIKLMSNLSCHCYHTAPPQNQGGLPNRSGSWRRALLSALDCNLSISTICKTTSFMDHKSTLWYFNDIYLLFAYGGKLGSYRDMVMVIMPMQLPTKVHEGGAEWGQDPASSSIFPWLHWVWESTRTAWASIHSNQIRFFPVVDTFPWHKKYCFYPRNAKRHFQKKDKKVKDEEENPWFPIMAEPEWTS